MALALFMEGFVWSDPAFSANDNAASATLSEEMDDLFAQLQKADTAQQASQIHEQLMRQWATSSSPTVTLLYERAVKAMAIHQTGRAMDLLDTALLLDPNFFHGYNTRAALHFQKGELGKSLSDLAMVLRLEPRHYGALSGLGLIFLQMNEEEKASQAFEKALFYNPHIEGARQHLERLQSQQAGQSL
jgi:tetratricopeptide (TPR) repeat protein